jgi:hypothetical protein
LRDYWQSDRQSDWQARRTNGHKVADSVEKVLSGYIVRGSNASINKVLQ